MESKETPHAGGEIPNLHHSGRVELVINLSLDFVLLAVVLGVHFLLSLDLALLRADRSLLSSGLAFTLIGSAWCVFGGVVRGVNAVLAWQARETFGAVCLLDGPCQWGSLGQLTQRLWTEAPAHRPPSASPAAIDQYLL